MKNVRYLDALAEALVVELKTLDEQDQALEALLGLAKLLREDAGCRERIIHARASRCLVDFEKMVRQKLPLPVANTVMILEREQAMTQLPKFIERFKAVRRRLELARDAEVVSAVALTQTESKKLREALEKKWGLHVALTEKVDPSIIGGLKVTAGDWLYDATVRGRLVGLVRQLKISQI